MRFVAIDLVADFVLFPLWWYTAGLARAIRMAGRWFDQTRQMMAVGLWAKNLFVPMFAQYDIWGRLISFLVRLFMVIVRSIGLVLITLVIGAALLAYAAFPVFLTVLIVFQIIGLS